MLNELRAHLAAGRNTQAAELADTLLKERPDSIDALHIGAIARARLGHVLPAQALFERALLITPEDPLLHMNFAQLHLAKGDLARAKGGYKAASMLDPNLSSAHTSLGNLAAIGGDVAGAEALYLTALRADPDALPALIGRGHLLLDRADAQTALPIARHAVNLNPKDARAQALLGRAFFASGHTDFAIQAFLNALKEKPNFFAARVMLARAMQVRGDLPGAEAELKRAAEVAPNDVTLMLVRAELYAQTGRSALAAADLDTILSQRPNDAALRARVGLHFSAGELDAGLALLRTACDARPTDWLINHALLGYLLDFGRASDARAAALSWTERAAQFAPAWMHLASIDEGQGAFDAARAAAETAQGLDAELPQVHLILARARLRAGRPGEALTLLSTMLAKNCSPEQRVEALGLRGRALDALGRRNEAVTSWQEAAELRVTAIKTAFPMLPRMVKTRGQTGGAMDALAIAADRPPNAPSIVFLTGLPMSGVESVAWWLAHASDAVVLNDRFTTPANTSRQDLLNSMTLDRLEIDFSASDLEHVRSRYLKALRRALPETTAPRALVVDWLPVLDVRQYRVLRRALPDARWLHVERDSRDILLGALMSGSNLLPIQRMGDAATLLGEHDAHLKAASAERRDIDFRFAFDSAKSEHVRLCQWLREQGKQVASEEHWLMANLSLGGLPAYFPAQRWQAFETPLSDAFGAL
jgi:tetratricopeptide (TPR) repeat protein